MYLISQKHKDVKEIIFAENIYCDNNKGLIIKNIHYSQPWPNTTLTLRIKEPHRARPVQPKMKQMSPIPRKSYPEPELVNRHRGNAINKRFVCETSLELPLIHKSNTRKTLLGISIGLSIENRDLKGKIKKTIYGMGVGLALTVVPVKEVLSQNNYDKDPVNNKNKTEVFYENPTALKFSYEEKKVPVINKDHKQVGYTTRSQASDSLAYSNKYKAYYDSTATALARQEYQSSSDDEFYGDQVLDSWEHPNVRNTNHSFDFTWDSYGSGDVDGDGDADIDDNNAIQSGVFNYRADVNGDGQITTVGSNSDKSIHLQYIKDQIPYIPGPHYKTSTTAEQLIWLDKFFALDSTNYIWFPGINCSDYSGQLGVKAWGVEKIAQSGINFNRIDTTDNGLWNLPGGFEVGTVTSTGIAHATNTFMVKDSVENFWHYQYREPQNDQIIVPGDFSLNEFANHSRYCYFYSQLLEDTIHNNFSTIGFININTDPVVDWQHPDLVVYEPWVDFYFNQGSNPADITINYEVTNPDNPDPDITGRPGAPDWATEIYNDSTIGRSSDPWDSTYYNFLIQRAWRGQSNEYDPIDTTYSSHDNLTFPNRSPQNIIFQDTASPAFVSGPQSPLIVNYGDPITSDVTGIPIFSDNSGLYTLTESDSIVELGNYSNPQNCNDLSRIIYRTFVSTDPSGNDSTWVHEIHEQDIQPPWWTYQPTSYNLQWTPDWEQDILDNIASNPATAQDNSPLYSVSWAMNGGPGSSGCSQFEFPITIPWNAQDSCQNIANPYFQYVNVFEGINPEIIPPFPPDTTVNCETDKSSSVLGIINAIDNTGINPSISISDSLNQNPDITDPGNTNYTIWRTQTAADDCGNISTLEQIIQVQDTTNSWFSWFAQDTYGNEFGYAVDSIPPQGADNSNYFVISFERDTVWGNSDPNSCEYINNAYLEDKWTISDASAGLTTQPVTQIHKQYLQETEPPQNPQAPGSMNYIYGDQITPTDTATATDNSWLVYSAWSIGNTTQNPDQTVCEHYKYDGEFDWILSDRCDNSVSITSPFNVDKPLSVIYEFFPADITVPEGDTIPNITGWPQAIDTLNPEILPVVYHYENELIFQNEFERWWARHWSVEDVCYQFTPDSIQYITEDLDVGFEPWPDKSTRCIIQLFPNPTKGKVYFSSHVDEVLIYNSFGERTVAHASPGCRFTERFVLDMSKYSSGLYYIQVITPEGKCIAKVVKL